MGEVITFVGYRPPQRFDSLPWTNAHVEEAATADGAFTQIDAFTLSPVDIDPAAPQARSFTTENGAALGYWYRVVFVDGTGDTSQPTSPVQNLAGSTAAPVVPYTTTDELFRILKIRNPTPQQSAAAERILDAAAGEINARMGRLNDLAGWELQLVTEVNLERGAELWNEEEVPFGAIGLDSPSGPVFVSRHSRALQKLTVLQQSWGCA